MYSPGASRLPIPSRLTPRSSSTSSPLLSPSARSQFRASTPNAHATPRSATHQSLKAEALAKEGFLSPQAVWASAPIAQAPKYQLRDPGVSSPRALAHRGRSAIPRPVRQPLSARSRQPIPSQPRPEQPRSEIMAMPVPRPSQPVRPPVSPVNPQSGKTARQTPQKVPKITSPMPSHRGRKSASSAAVSSRMTPRGKPSIPTHSDTTQRMLHSPSIGAEKTPTMSSRQYSATSISAVSTASTADSSTYSSASSMARARAAEAERITFIRRDSSESDTPRLETDCAPYMVPKHGPEMTLTWQPDEESTGMDPAEMVWRTLERKLGRRLCGDDDMVDRGRWVAQALPDTPSRAPQGCDMEKTLSEFTVSAYSSMADEGQETALFNMSGPLIQSVSISAATPANTPCFRSETLRRARHIRRKPGSAPMSRSGSAQSTASDKSAVSEGTKSSDTASDDSLHTNMSHEPPSSLMYRLDSHVISALSALQGVFDSPDLDAALGAKGIDEDEDEIEHDDALGFGMHIKMSSVYSLLTLPRGSRLSTAKRGSGTGSMRFAAGRGEEGEVESDIMTLTDLDTGEVVSMNM